MPAKLHATHHFTGNETSLRTTPYNPGAYDPPQQYPVASSLAPSAVAASAAVPSRPNAEPLVHRKLLKKLSQRLRKEPAEPAADAPYIDWESIVADTSGLSRYPAMSAAGSTGALHAHPHKKLDHVHATNEGRPNIHNISDRGVMKNPSRSPKDEDPDSDIESYSDSDRDSLSDKTRWPRAGSRASSRRNSYSASQYTYSKDSLHHDPTHTHRSDRRDPSHHSSHRRRRSERQDDHHKPRHSSSHAPSEPSYAPSRSRSHSISHPSTQLHHSTSAPKYIGQLNSEDPIARMTADLERSTSLLDTARAKSEAWHRDPYHPARSSHHVSQYLAWHPYDYSAQYGPSAPFSTPWDFHNMQNHGKLINPALDYPLVSHEFFAKHPESTGFYQYAGWQAPGPHSSAAPYPNPPPKTSGSWKSWRPSFGQSKSKSMDNLLASRQQDYEDRQRTLRLSGGGPGSYHAPPLSRSAAVPVTESALATRQRRYSWAPFATSYEPTPQRSALVPTDPRDRQYHERRRSRDLHPRFEESEDHELPRRNRESGQAPMYPVTRHPKAYQSKSHGRRESGGSYPDI